MPIGVMRYLTD